VSWVRSRTVEVYLGSTTVGCRGLDDLGDRWAEASRLDAGLARLGEWMAGSADPLRARVWLGAGLARPLVVAPGSGARNAREARELASVLAADVTGLGDELKVWLAPWRAGRTTLAVAIPQPLLASLRALAGARRGQRVVSVRPWWNQVLDAAIERSRTGARSIGWTVAEPDGLVQGRIVSGEVAEAAFEAPRTHDPDGALIRRRLEIGWGDLDEVEHLVFRPAATNPERYAVGGAEGVQRVEAVE
jgi:hypothetical protein